MQQDYDRYTSADQEVWRKLFARQEPNIQDKAGSVYLRCLQEMKPVLHAEAIPRFEELSRVLTQKNGWSIKVVKGLVEVSEFFDLLRKRRFPSSTWLRKPEQLDYLEEPDMFHDIFGHIPQFMDDQYAAFMQRFGEFGYQNRHDPEVVTQLQRLYWFTIEFGVLREGGRFRIYGAGILSSFAETNHVMEHSDLAVPFDIKQIIDTDYDLSRIQEIYFQIESFEGLYQAIKDYEQIAKQETAV